MNSIMAKQEHQIPNFIFPDLPLVPVRIPDSFPDRTGTEIETKDNPGSSVRMPRLFAHKFPSRHHHLFQVL
jgi:hypothetical protein